MRLKPVPFLTATAAELDDESQENIVHARLESKTSTVCNRVIYETSNAEFEIGHPDNCLSCENRLKRMVKRGVVVE